MSTHNPQQFAAFLAALVETNATLDFWTDFEKVKKNVAEIEISLNTLNYLLGQDDLASAVEALWARDKTAFEVLPILIAVRRNDKRRVLADDGEIKLLTDYVKTPDSVMEFLEGTGLAKFFREKVVSNLVDYVFGVEVGLDTNGRKNRSGKIMEKIVSKIFEDNNISFRREVNSTQFPEVHSALDGDKKRFDFVIETPRHTYLVETNFYSGGGSKPNETARSYTEIAPKINALSKYQFVWITDGKGWNSAKSKMSAAYFSIPLVYNLADIKDFVALVKADFE